MIGNCTPKEFEFFVVLARKIWFQRHSVVHSGLIFNGSNELIIEANISIEKFQKSHAKDIEQETAEASTSAVIWKAQPEDVHKVNLNVAIDSLKW
jgi:hypothetical protein